MKKHLVLALGLLAGTLALPAQMQVLKDAERAMKDGVSPDEVVSIITPAFTNPETEKLAKTYYIPGKAMFDAYDQLYGFKQFGKLPEGGDMMMSVSLVSGYGFYMQALPLDSLPNEKGKVKPKYSKEIINTIGGHYMDYNTAAITFWEGRDYAGAYAAWDIFLSLGENPTFAKALNTEVNDTVIGEIYYNQALAAWQADQLQNALKAFEKAKAKGYNKKQLYDYAIAVASNLEDYETLYKYSEEALPLYGKEDPMYLGQIINYYMRNNEFDRAYAAIDQAIAAEPNNAQYYLAKGVLYDNQTKLAEAKTMFAKAVELDGDNSQALYNYGRILCEEAYDLSDKAPADINENVKYYNEQIKPLFEAAIPYLEKAFELDSENRNALNYLENVYYNLQDEKNLKRIEEIKKFL